MIKVILTYFNKLLQLTKTPEGNVLAEKAYKHYLDYLNMLKEEMSLVQTKKDYPIFLYQQNKEKVINVINQTLNELISLNQLSINKKIESSEKASNQAVKLIGYI